MKIWQKTANVGFGRFPAEVAKLLVERTPVHNFAKPNEKAKVAKKKLDWVWNLDDMIKNTRLQKLLHNFKVIM